MGKGHRAGGNSTGSTTDRLNKDPRQRGGLRRRVLREDLDGLVGEIYQEIGLGVVVGAGRKPGISYALVNHIGHRAEHVLDWRAYRLEGAYDLLAFVQGPTIAADQGEHGIAIGRIKDKGVYGQLIGGGLAELPIEAEHLLGLAQGVGHHPSQNRRADGVELILKEGDDAEISAAAAQAPKEVLVLRGAGRQEAAVGEDHISRDEIVDGKAVLAVYNATAATESESGDARIGGSAASGGESKGLSLVVELDPVDPRL